MSMNSENNIKYHIHQARMFRAVSICLSKLSTLFLFFNKKTNIAFALSMKPYFCHNIEKRRGRSERPKMDPDHRMKKFKATGRYSDHDEQLQRSLDPSRHAFLPIFTIFFVLHGIQWLVRTNQTFQTIPLSFSHRNNAVIPKISKHTHNHIHRGVFASLHRLLKGEDKTRLLRRIFDCRTYNYSATTLPN